MPRRCRRLTELGIATDLSNERSGAAVSYNVEENYKMIKLMWQDFLMRGWRVAERSAQKNPRSHVGGFLER